jgi:hypothetical protein
MRPWYGPRAPNAVASQCRQTQRYFAAPQFRVRNSDRPNFGIAWLKRISDLNVILKSKIAQLCSSLVLAIPLEVTERPCYQGK